jgi:hypothetical protein
MIVVPYPLFGSLFIGVIIGILLEKSGNTSKNYEKDAHAGDSE